MSWRVGWNMDIAQYCSTRCFVDGLVKCGLNQAKHTFNRALGRRRVKQIFPPSSMFGSILIFSKANYIPLKYQCQLIDTGFRIWRMTDSSTNKNNQSVKEKERSRSQVATAAGLCVAGIIVVWTFVIPSRTQTPAAQSSPKTTVGISQVTSNRFVVTHGLARGIFFLFQVFFQKSTTRIWKIILDIEEKVLYFYCFVLCRYIFMHNNEYYLSFQIW